MSSVHSEACEHFRLAPSNFSMRHSSRKTPVDLSQPFRLTGLHQNTTVELVPGEGKKAAGQVRVGLRMPGGERAEGSFSSNASLWDVLEQLAPHLLLSGPVLQFMRAAYSGEDGLRSTTLHSIGLSGGSAMFAVSLSGEGGSTSATASATASTAASSPVPSQSSPPLRPPQPAITVNSAPVLNAAAPPPPAPSGIPTPNPAPLPPTSSPKPAGMAGCWAAIDMMKANQFDADTVLCILTLIKYVDNVLYRPGDLRTRTIRIANNAFRSRVGVFQGGPDFLQALGFEVKMDTGSAMSYEIAQNPENFMVMRLEPAKEDEGLLKDARQLLVDQAMKLGVAPEGIPRPPAPPVQPAPDAQPQQAFDPFQTHVVSVVPRFGGGGEESSTERELKRLQGRRAAIESVQADRQLTLIYPSTSNQSTTAPAVASAEEEVDSRSDMAIIAQRVARIQAERKRAEDAPFQTQAMRELHRLRNAVVYNSTLLRIQFPTRERVQLQATFHPQENIESVCKVIRESLSEQLRDVPFHLYISPPKKRLDGRSILAEEGLVPAALVYLSWEGQPAAAEGRPCFRSDLMEAAGKGADSQAAEVAQYPSGVRLTGDGAATSAAAAPTSRSRGGDEETKSKGGKRGKPSWLKL
jgi:hypothetical protein